MKNTTLCYVEKDGAYLMLHRVKKENDVNAGKWVGVGGHFEEKESPFDCAVREIYEETGLAAAALCYRGVVSFVSDAYETEQMHLFTVPDFLGDDCFPRYENGRVDTESCSEGNLAWVKKDEVFSLPLWEGDKVFLSLLDGDEPFFALKLVYQGDTLVSATLNGLPHSV
jgi:8-oxo-dGTP diphosphatase